MNGDGKESSHHVRHEQASALKLKAEDQSVHHLLNARKRPRSCEHHLDHHRLLHMDIHPVIATHHAQVRVIQTPPSSQAIRRIILTNQENAAALLSAESKTRTTTAMTAPAMMKITPPHLQPIAHPIIAAIPHHTLAPHPAKAPTQSVKLPHDLVEILLHIPHQGTNLHQGTNPLPDYKEIVHEREIDGIVEAGI